MCTILAYVEGMNSDEDNFVTYGEPFDEEDPSKVPIFLFNINPRQKELSASKGEAAGLRTTRTQ